MKLYLKIVAFIVFCIGWFGFVGPFCISGLTELVIGWIVITVILAPFTFLYFKKELWFIMKHLKSMFMVLVISLVAMSTVGCGTRVPAGEVGVKVYMLGSQKGVDNEVLPVGRYWIGMNEELFLYPVYQINYTFDKYESKSSHNNEEFSFQTVEGMQCEMDMGVSLRFDQTKIAKMFAKYRKGPEEIRGIVVRNALRDALNKVAGAMPVESVYGEGKSKLIDSVKAIVKSELDSTGIIIENVSLIGSVRIPDAVQQALNAKVTATQDAQKAENQLRTAEAEAKKAVATAQGVADANKIKRESLTSEILEMQRLQNEAAAIEKWDGKLPVTLAGTATPFLNLK